MLLNIRRKFLRWLEEADEEYLRDIGRMHYSNRTPAKKKKSKTVLHVSDDDYESVMSAEEALMFKVFYAKGGVVIETRVWDRAEEEFKYTLHTVSEDQSLSTTIDDIVMLHAISKDKK